MNKKKEEKMCLHASKGKIIPRLQSTEVNKRWTISRRLKPWKRRVDKVEFVMFEPISVARSPVYIIPKHSNSDEEAKDLHLLYYRENNFEEVKIFTEHRLNRFQILQ